MTDDVVSLGGETTPLDREDLDHHVRMLLARVIRDRDGNAARALRALVAERAPMHRYAVRVVESIAHAPADAAERYRWAARLTVDHEDHRELAACFDTHPDIGTSEHLAEAREASARYRLIRLAVAIADAARNERGDVVTRLVVSLTDALYSLHGVPRAA